MDDNDGDDDDDDSHNDNHNNRKKCYKRPQISGMWRLIEFDSHHRPGNTTELSVLGEQADKGVGLFVGINMAADTVTRVCSYLSNDRGE